MRNDWLKKLKAGDKVAVASPSAILSYSIYTVKRVTKTQIALNEIATKYRIDSGYRVGSSPWNFSSLIEATPELINDIRIKKHRSNMVYQFNNIDENCLTIEQLEKIIKIAE